MFYVDKKVKNLFLCLNLWDFCVFDEFENDALGNWAIMAKCLNSKILYFILFQNISNSYVCYYERSAFSFMSARCWLKFARHILTYFLYKDKYNFYYNFNTYYD